MKVLIISHNCFGTTQSMGKTLLSLFATFKKEELMQLYLYPSLPSADLCGSYYRMTDRDVLRSIWRRGHCGQAMTEISPANGLYETEKDEKHYTGRKKGRVARRLRDVMWRLGNTKSTALKTWLREGAPDVIFYALGDDTFSQRLALWAATYLQIPLVTYICDEFYFSYKNAGLGTRIWRGNVPRYMKKTMRHTAHTVTICEELGARYAERFGKPFTTVMTGSSFFAGTLPREKDAYRVSYIGNFGLGRWRSLLDIAATLKEIEKETGIPCSLTYYGNEHPALCDIAYGGRLNEAQVRETMGRSALLIHTESFEKKQRERLLYSVSTKVADCLASGVCLFAYGPAEIASMQHLTAHRAAITATAHAELKEKLKAALIDDALIAATEQNALETARIYHDATQNSARLYALLCAVSAGDTV